MQFDYANNIVVRVIVNLLLLNSNCCMLNSFLDILHFYESINLGFIV